MLFNSLKSLCITNSSLFSLKMSKATVLQKSIEYIQQVQSEKKTQEEDCLLYTSDAADE